MPTLMNSLALPLAAKPTDPSARSVKVGDERRDVLVVHHLRARKVLFVGRAGAGVVGGEDHGDARRSGTCTLHSAEISHWWPFLNTSFKHRLTTSRAGLELAELAYAYVTLHSLLQTLLEFAELGLGPGLA